MKSGASTHSEMVNFEFRRTPDFDVTLSHVTDFPNARQALWFRFFSLFSKKVLKKSRSKSGDRMMPASMANRFKERSLLEQLQNHASNYRGALGLSRPSDPPRKKVIIFRRRRRRTGFPRFCFASLNVKSASRKNSKIHQFCFRLW